MEHPHDPYHIRPFPQQPHRGSKDLVAALKELQTKLLEDVPDMEGLRTIQKRIHDAANIFNDDRLVDLIRQISKSLEGFLTNPDHFKQEKIEENILKALVEFKHM